MALKRKVTKDEFDKLPADIKAEYIEKDGAYVLDLAGEGGDDTAALRRAKDREVQARKDAEQRARDAEEKLSKLDESDARKRGDIDALEKSWKEKYDAQESTHKQTVEGKDAFIRKTLLDDRANTIAAAISDSPAILVPHIRARLAADLDGDAPVTKVLTADGNASALTLDDLQKEFVDNKDFASVIRASKANGGGAPNKATRTRHSSATQQSGETPKLASMSPKDLASQIAAKKDAAPD